MDLFQLFLFSWVTDLRLYLRNGCRNYLWKLRNSLLFYIKIVFQDEELLIKKCSKYLYYKKLCNQIDLSPDFVASLYVQIVFNNLDKDIMRKCVRSTFYATAKHAICSLVAYRKIKNKKEFFFNIGA